MPTYEYECKSCKYAFEFFQSMKDEPLKTCPECGKELRRLINGGTGIIFKGNGFYATDKSAPAAKPAADASKTPQTSSPCQGCPAAGGGNGSGKSATPACPKAANSQ